MWKILSLVLFLATISSAVATDSHNASDWYNLGMAINRMAINQSQELEAIEAIHQALRLDPDNPLYWEGLGIVAFPSKYEEALNAFDKAVELWAENQSEEKAHDLAGKAIILYQLGRYNETITACDKALLLNPNDIDALDFKAKALTKLEEY
jgi:tetratricopeptide (TPR) repeat protein